MSNIIRSFDSVEAYKAVISQPMTTNDAKLYIKYTEVCHLQKLSNMAHVSDTNWLGAPQAEFARIDRSGIWEEGAARVRELATLIEVPPLPCMKRRNVRSDQGDWIDMQSVYSGNLSRAWTRKSRAAATGTKRNFNIIVPMQGTADVEASVFFWRAAAALALSDSLAEAGFNVAVTADYSVYYGLIKDRTVDRITLKPYLMPLDVASLAATVCLAGFKRTYGFAHAFRFMNERIGSYCEWYSVNSEKLDDDEVVGFEKIEDQRSAQMVVARIANDIANHQEAA